MKPKDGLYKCFEHGEDYLTLVLGSQGRYTNFTVNANFCYDLSLLEDQESWAIDDFSPDLSERYCVWELVVW